MTGGQLALMLAVLASVAMSATLLVAVRRQSASIDSVRQSVDRLSGQPSWPAAVPPTGPTTTASVSQPLTTPQPLAPQSQPSLSTALLGVPLVKLAALFFGLRQALDADHRRHLSQVVDQELRAARRRRRTATMGSSRTSARAR